MLALAALLAACTLPASASALDPVLSDTEKQDKIVSLLEAWVPFAESFYRSGPPTYFDADGAGVSLERGEGSVALVYATLLTAEPRASTIGGISRTTMENHVEDAIDDVISSHVSRIGRAGWGGGPAVDWQAATKAAVTGWAAQLAWNTLDARTRADIEDVVTQEADAVAAASPDDLVPGNSGAEQNLNYAYVVAVAAAIMPGSRRNATWQEAAIRMTLNGPSVAADDTSRTSIDGHELGWWVETANLFDDWTMTNHGFFHPVYEQGILASEGEMAAWYADTATTIPSAFGWRSDTVWDEVLGYLIADDGDIVAPQTTDWVRHDYQHIEAFAAAATRLGRDDASVYESRALELLERRQQTHRNGSLYGMSQLGYEADVAKTLADAWLIHEHFGPSPEPDATAFEAARDDFYGVKQFPDASLIVANHGGTIATFSWEDGAGIDSGVEPMGLVVPSDEGNEDDPVFVSYETNNLIGGLAGDVDVATFHCRCDETWMFSTAGTFTVPAGRKYSMTSFDDGSTLLLDRGVGETFGYNVESIAGLGGRRTVYDQNGAVGSYGSLRGSWFNIADRLGMVVEGGAGIAYEHRDNGDNPSGWDNVAGDRGTGSTQHRGALVLPNATATETAAADADVLQPTVPSSDWSALTAIVPDGTGRIAVANWGASRATGTISGLASSKGVPIPDTPSDVTVTGRSGSTDFTLGAVSSTGEKVHFFVASSGSNTVTVRPISETLVKLTNGGASNTVTVKYDVGEGDVTYTESATLAAGEVAYAVEYGGGVRIVTPSASSTDGSHPASLAFDGNTSSSSYWSSASTSTLSARSPECLVLGFSSSAVVGRVTMVPRSGFGPKDYVIQTSNGNTACTSDTGWTTRATVTNAGDGTTKTHTWTPTGNVYVRIKVTAAYGSSPYNVGIKELTPAPR